MLWPIRGNMRFFKPIRSKSKSTLNYVCSLSRPYHRLQVFPRLPTVASFPALDTGASFPALCINSIFRFEFWLAHCNGYLLLVLSWDFYLEITSSEMLSYIKGRVFTPTYSAHCNQLLGRCGMNCDSIIKIFLCCPHFDRYGESLQHFITTYSQNVQSNNLKE